MLKVDIWIGADQNIFLFNLVFLYFLYLLNFCMNRYPDPYSHRSGSRRLLNTDPMRIRNTAYDFALMFIFRMEDLCHLLGDAPEFLEGVPSLSQAFEKGFFALGKRNPSTCSNQLSYRYGQCRGSALIFCGSRSSCFFQCGSGSGSSLSNFEEFSIV